MRRSGYSADTPTMVGAASIQTLIGSQLGRIANEMEQAATEFDRPIELSVKPIAIYAHDGEEITSRYARITTRAHPGIRARLGWTISDASFDDLRAQLTIEKNALERSEIQTWLTRDLTCGDRS
ncbi:MAG: hypothetical protein U9R51_06735 [Actinomycetota bacterium]|nr:hypothetical protein [Actinomycetota bacterium]